MMRGNVKGFTVVEALLALVIAAGMMLVASTTLLMVQNYMTEEGSVEFAGDNYAIAPSSAESVRATNVVAAVRSEIAGARWAMVADRPFAVGTEGVPNEFRRLGSLTVEDLGSPSAFTAAMTAAGFPFGSEDGFTLLLFRDQTTLMSMLVVRWYERDGYRLYSVGLHSSASGSARVSYSFSEKNELSQTLPRLTPFLRQGRVSGFEIELPDPSCRYALNHDRITRTMQASPEREQALARLQRDSSLCIIAPLSP